MLRGKRLFLGVSDPTNVQAIDEIKFQSGCRVDPVVVELRLDHRLIPFSFGTCLPYYRTLEVQPGEADPLEYIRGLLGQYVRLLYTGVGLRVHLHEDRRRGPELPVADLAQGVLDTGRAAHDERL